MNARVVGGLFAVHKPSGITSRKCIDLIKSQLFVKRGDGKLRIGHGGILDSFASGVLVVGVGREHTKKLGKYLTDCNKSYIAEGIFGYSTETLCPESDIVETKEFSHVTSESVERILENMIGNVNQRVPKYSAGKVNGMRLSEYARNEIEIELPIKQVVLHEAKLLEFDLPRFTIQVTCGSGFYVRTLIHDIGIQLGTLASITKLCRTRQGEFTVDDPNTLEYENWNRDNIQNLLLQQSEE
jgi:tRNA pseudouridine55 synthase